MPITHNTYYDMFHIGSIIRNKDILSSQHNINITMTNHKHGGSNGRTYQLIIFTGSNSNIINAKKDIRIIETQAENDYQDRRKRKQTKYNKQTHNHTIFRKQSNLTNIYKLNRTVCNNSFSVLDF